MHVGSRRALRQAPEARWVEAMRTCKIACPRLLCGAGASSTSRLTSCPLRLLHATDRRPSAPHTEELL